MPLFETTLNEKLGTKGKPLAIKGLTSGAADYSESWLASGCGVGSNTEAVWLAQKAAQKMPNHTLLSLYSNEDIEKAYQKALSTKTKTKTKTTPGATFSHIQELDALSGRINGGRGPKVDLGNCVMALASQFDGMESKNKDAVLFDDENIGAVIRDNTQGPRAQRAAPLGYAARFAHKLDNPDTHMLTNFIEACGKEEFNKCFFYQNGYLCPIKGQETDALELVQQHSDKLIMNIEKVPLVDGGHVTQVPCSALAMGGYDNLGNDNIDGQRVRTQEGEQQCGKMNKILLTRQYRAMAKTAVIQAKATGERTTLLLTPVGGSAFGANPQDVLSAMESVKDIVEGHPIDVVASLYKQEDVNQYGQGVFKAKRVPESQVSDERPFTLSEGIAYAKMHPIANSSRERLAKAQGTVIAEGNLSLGDSGNRVTSIRQLDDGKIKIVGYNNQNELQLIVLTPEPNRKFSVTGFKGTTNLGLCEKEFKDNFMNRNIQQKFQIRSLRDYHRLPTSVAASQDRQAVSSSPVQGSADRESDEPPFTEAEFTHYNHGLPMGGLRAKAYEQEVRGQKIAKGKISLGNGFHVTSIRQVNSNALNKNGQFKIVGYSHNDPRRLRLIVLTPEPNGQYSMTGYQGTTTLGPCEKAFADNLDRILQAFGIKGTKDLSQYHQAPTSAALPRPPPRRPGRSIAGSGAFQEGGAKASVGPLPLPAEPGFDSNRVTAVKKVAPNMVKIIGQNASGDERSITLTYGADNSYTVKGYRGKQLGYCEEDFKKNIQRIQEHFGIQIKRKRPDVKTVPSKASASPFTPQLESLIIGPKSTVYNIKFRNGISLQCSIDLKGNKSWTGAGASKTLSTDESIARDQVKIPQLSQEFGVNPATKRPPKNFSVKLARSEQGGKSIIITEARKSRDGTTFNADYIYHKSGRFMGVNSPEPGGSGKYIAIYDESNEKLKSMLKNSGIEPPAPEKSPHFKPGAFEP